MKTTSFDLSNFNLQTFNVRERYKTFVREWPNRTPQQKWQIMADIPGILLQIFGIRILSDCRIYWLSFLGSFLALNYFGLSMYTIIYYAKSGRFMYGTRCLCGVGIVATVSFVSLELFSIFFFNNQFYRQFLEYHFVCEVLISRSIQITNVISFFGRFYL